jgi:hypothetical protein
MAYRKMIKPKATAKSTARDAEKYLKELQGINERLKLANNQLAQAHIATHEWIKSLERRLEQVEVHCGLAKALEVPGETLAESSSEGPGVEISSTSESRGVSVDALNNIPVEIVNSQ